jgi:hypothetical protein
LAGHEVVGDQNAIACATSSGRPTRPTGVLAAKSLNIACFWASGMASHQGDINHARGDPIHSHGLQFDCEDLDGGGQ